MQPLSHKQTISCSEVCPRVTKPNTSICCQDLLLWFNNSCSNAANLTDKIWVRVMGQWRLYNRPTGDKSGVNDLRGLLQQCLQKRPHTVTSAHTFLI